MTPVNPEQFLCRTGEVLRPGDWVEYIPVMWLASYPYRGRPTTRQGTYVGVRYMNILGRSMPMAMVNEGPYVAWGRKPLGVLDVWGRHKPVGSP